MIGAALGGRSPSEASEPVPSSPSESGLLAAAPRASVDLPQAADAAPPTERRDRFELDQVPHARVPAARLGALRSGHVYEK